MPFVWIVIAWKPFVGRRLKKKRKNSCQQCAVATFRGFCGKERGQETHWVSSENAALVEEARRSRMQLSWYFIHQLIYGLHTALNDPLLSLWAWALGNVKALQGQKQRPGGQRVWETSTTQAIDFLIVLWVRRKSFSAQVRDQTNDAFSAHFLPVQMW